MRKRQSFKNLIEKNKRELLTNGRALEKIELKLEEKQSDKSR